MRGVNLEPSGDLAQSERRGGSVAVLGVPESVIRYAAPHGQVSDGEVALYPKAPEFSREPPRVPRSKLHYATPLSPATCSSRATTRARLRR